MRVADHRGQKQRLLAASRAEADRRAMGCAELLAVGRRLGEARLSPAATEVLLELLGAATATMGPHRGEGSATLVDHRVALWVTPAESDLVIRGDGGDLSAHNLDIVVTSGARPVWGRAAPTRNDALVVEDADVEEEGTA